MKNVRLFSIWKITLCICFSQLLNSNFSSAKALNCRFFAGPELGIEWVNTSKNHLNEVLNIHSGIFFSKGLSFGLTTKVFNFNLGIIRSYEEVYGYNENGYKYWTEYFGWLKLDIIRVPVSIDLRMTEKDAIYVFFHSGINFDSTQTVSFKKNSFKLEENKYDKISSYRANFDFGMGFNFALYRQLRMNFLLSYYLFPFTQKTYFGEDVQMDKFVTKVGVFWVF